VRQVGYLQEFNLYDIYLMLCVQSWTPYYGRKDRPKHVEWYSINSKIVHLVGFTTELEKSVSAYLVTHTFELTLVEVQYFHND